MLKIETVLYTSEYIYVKITAPLYWWNNFHEYTNSIVDSFGSFEKELVTKKFVIDDFSHEHLLSHVNNEWKLRGKPPYKNLHETIITLNKCRDEYLKTKDEKYLQQIIQLLPNSYIQSRNVTLDYRLIIKIYDIYKNHTSGEWFNLCEWMRHLPYREIILS